VLIGLLPVSCRAEVGGVVVAPDRQPVAGARVALLGEQSWRPVVLTETTTDEGGRFVLAPPRGSIARQVVV